MATVKQTIFIHAYYPYDDPARTPSIMIMTYKSSDPEIILFEEREIEIEVPTHRHVAERVNKLQAKKNEIYADAAQEVTKIEQKLQTLLAIEYSIDTSTEL